MYETYKCNISVVCGCLEATGLSPLFSRTWSTLSVCCINMIWLLRAAGLWDNTVQWRCCKSVCVICVFLSVFLSCMGFSVVVAATSESRGAVAHKYLWAESKTMQGLFKSGSAERISHDAVWKPHQTAYTLTGVFVLGINPKAVVFFWWNGVGANCDVGTLTPVLRFTRDRFIWSSFNEPRSCSRSFCSGIIKIS